MKDILFCVITKIPDPENDDGNLASPIVYGLSPDATLAVMLNGRIEVFALGEIVIIGSDDREISGRERKPSKWNVEAEYFNDIESAVKRAIQVKAA